MKLEIARAALTEHLGLLDDARGELRRLVSECEVSGDLAARDEVLARLRELG